jgi:hypothetical protein
MLDRDQCLNWLDSAFPEKELLRPSTAGSLRKGRAATGRHLSSNAGMRPMEMRPTDKDIDTEIREGEKHHDVAHRALAVEAVTRWNAAVESGRPRHRPDWSPMIGVRSRRGTTGSMGGAPAAGSTSKSTCAKSIVIRRQRCTGLIPSLSCRSCQPSPPFAQLVKLSKHDWQSPNAPAFVPPRGGY